jgi:hypothetical protein
MYPQVALDLDAWSVEEQADVIVAEIVSAGLPRPRLVAGTTVEQDDGEHTIRVAAGRPVFLLGLAFENLVTLAHLWLALLLTQQVEVRQCEGCARVFVPERPNQRHHDKQCADRARTRRHRERSKDA